MCIFECTLTLQMYLRSVIQTFMLKKCCCQMCRKTECYDLFDSYIYTGILTTSSVLLWVLYIEWRKLIYSGKQSFFWRNLFGNGTNCLSMEHTVNFSEIDKQTGIILARYFWVKFLIIIIIMHFSKNKHFLTWMILKSCIIF